MKLIVTTQSADVIYPTIKNSISQHRAQLIVANNQMASSDIQFEELAEIYITNQRIIDYIAVVQNTPGLRRWARRAESVSGYNIITELQEFLILSDELHIKLRELATSITVVDVTGIDLWLSSGVQISTKFTPQETESIRVSILAIINGTV